MASVGGQHAKTWIVGAIAALTLLGSGVLIGVGVAGSTDEAVDEVDEPTDDSTADADDAATEQSSDVDPTADDGAPVTVWSDPPATTPTATGDAGTFVETFTGSPAVPTPWASADWDITIHSRDVESLDVLDPMQAAHGPDCSPSDATHLSTEYATAVYQCKDHLMTAINGPDYAMIYLTPDQMIDFSDEAVIRFDVSTHRDSVRDWWDVWITPYDDNLQLPLDLGSEVDATGPPRRSVQVMLGTENQVKATIRDEFEPVLFPNWPEDVVTGDVFTGWETFLEPDARRRDTVEIRLSPTHLKVGMPDYDFWWIDSDIPEIEWTSGVVQFGHHSYNPSKDCNTTNNPRPAVAECLPNTWHWDNVQMSPTVPFTVVHSSARQATSDAPTMTLDAPAPADAHLRFAGIGLDLEVRFDGGDWQPAQLQATVRETKEEHFASYWHPIPEGTTTVEFRGDDWWADRWRVRDVTVWSPHSP